MEEVFSPEYWQSPLAGASWPASLTWQHHWLGRSRIRSRSKIRSRFWEGWKRFSYLNTGDLLWMELAGNVWGIHRILINAILHPVTPYYILATSYYTSLNLTMPYYTLLQHPCYTLLHLTTPYNTLLHLWLTEPYYTLLHPCSPYYTLLHLTTPNYAIRHLTALYYRYLYILENGRPIGMLFLGLRRALWSLNEMTKTTAPRTDRQTGCQRSSTNS